ncbi:MAG: hypothetical protein OEU84_10580 [Xanthomonadales bacterium]|nr:hypothetical protein [Xanthomonadales bacterium]MDH4020034.1 hypothetical protein [Xanthomonadales bacterium]
MNSVHNNGENDKSLDEGMKKLDQAYTQLSDEQPPELLDQAILNRAHRAVENKPHWMQFGWLHGLTTTAVVVLAISLFLNQREQLPDFENDIQMSEPGRLRLENADKKQSPVMRASEQDMELKEERGKRLDANQAAPVATEPQSAAVEITIDEQAEEAVTDPLNSGYATKIPQTKPDSIDKDLSGNEPVLEEQLLGDTALADDVAEREVISKQAEPATVTIGLTGEIDNLAETDAEIEQQLQEIILLKQSGDEAWKIALERFKENHPGYPLPKELSD